MEKRLKISKSLITALVFLIVAAVFLYQGWQSYQFNQQLLASSGSKLNLQQIPGLTLATVTRVVDGDTIVVSINNQNFTVRFVGMNTPETVDPRKSVECFGAQASSETKKLLTGQSVYLAKDISEMDKYKRLLRFVYLPLPDGSLLFVNDYLVRSGYAVIDNFPPDITQAPRFLAAEQVAQSQNLGLWSACTKEQISSY